MLPCALTSSAQPIDASLERSTLDARNESLRDEVSRAPRRIAPCAIT